MHQPLRFLRRVGRPIGPAGVALALLGAAVMGCGGNSTSPVSARVVGEPETYVLQSVNGRTLPLTLGQTFDGATLELFGATLTLNADSTYVSRGMLRATAGDVVTTTTPETAGQYRRVARGDTAAVVFTEPSGGSATFTLLDAGAGLRGPGIPVARTGGHMVADMRTNDVYVYTRH